MKDAPRVLLLTMRFRLAWCRSLKDRRSEARRLLSRLRQQFNLSAVDSGPQGVHTLLDITIAALCFDRAQADSMQENILAYAEGLTQAELYAVEAELL